MKRANCISCSGEGISYRQIGKFKILRCPDCRLIWVEEVGEKDLEAVYEDGYFFSDSIIGYDNYLRNEKNHRKNFRSILSVVHEKADLKNKRILDVGCAYGFLMDEAVREYGCDAYGLDVSTHAVEYAKKKGHKAINSKLKRGVFEEEFFDVVFIIGSIEHFSSPEETFAVCRDILKDGGLIIVTTLDTGGMLPLYSLKPPEHLFYFSFKNLGLLMEKSGFEVINHKILFWRYQVYDVFNRLSKYFSSRFFDAIGRMLETRFKNLSIKIPTNEMMVMARKGRPGADLR